MTLQPPTSWRTGVPGQYPCRLLCIPPKLKGWWAHRQNKAKASPSSHVLQSVQKRRNLWAISSCFQLMPTKQPLVQDTCSTSWNPSHASAMVIDISMEQQTCTVDNIPHPSPRGPLCQRGISVATWAWSGSQLISKAQNTFLFDVSQRQSAASPFLGSLGMGSCWGHGIFQRQMPHCKMCW